MQYSNTIRPSVLIFTTIGLDETSPTPPHRNHAFLLSAPVLPSSTIPSLHLPFSPSLFSTSLLPFPHFSPCFSPMLLLYPAPCLLCISPSPLFCLSALFITPASLIHFPLPSLCCSFPQILFPISLLSSLFRSLQSGRALDTNLSE